MTRPSDLAPRLRTLRPRVASLLPCDLRTTPATVFDLGPGNPDLAALDLRDVAGFTRYVFEEMERRGTPLGFGRYAEERVVYRHRALFGEGEEPRSLHLGLDLFSPPGTPVASPLAGRIHSFADNDRPGDYGPTVVIEHATPEATFCTLHGHLARRSMASWKVGAPVATGERIGWLGDASENGGWPPHLHLQLIVEMRDHRGDYPGVAAPSQRDEMLRRCPDPNLLLGIPALER